LRANGWAGQAQPNGGASRNRDTKNNLGLKKFTRRSLGAGGRRISPPKAGGRHGGQKFPFPRPLSFFARRAFEFFLGGNCFFNFEPFL